MDLIPRNNKEIIEIIFSVNTQKTHILIKIPEDIWKQKKQKIRAYTGINLNKFLEVFIVLKLNDKVIKEISEVIKKK